MKKNNKGFTLVELIIVMAIIAILAAVIAPNLMQYINKSKKTKDIATAETIATAVSAAAADKNTVPSWDKVTLANIVTKSESGKNDDETVIAQAIVETLGGKTKVGGLKTFNSQDFKITLDPTSRIAKNIIIYTANDGKNTDIEIYPDRSGEYK